MTSSPGDLGVRPGRLRNLVRETFSEGLRQRWWLNAVQTPVFAEIYAFLDPGVRPRRLTRKTDLLIEGFPRSGNTYAQAAFVQANGPQVRLAHHLHAVRSVQLAAKFGTPTILLIRDPEKVLGSMLQFNANYDAAVVCAGYRKYHQALLPFARSFIVAEFSQVVGDFGRVVERCNTRFGTAFQPYVRSVENESIVKRMIEQEGSSHSPDRFESAVSRPSEHRKSAEEVLSGLSQQDRLALAEARRVYLEMKDLVAEER